MRPIVPYCLVCVLMTIVYSSAELVASELSHGTEPLAAQKFTYSIKFWAPQTGEESLYAEGMVRWMIKDQNSWQFELQASNAYAKEKKGGGLQTQVMSPFRALVTMDKKEDVPLSVEITRAKSDANDIDYAAEKYGTVCKVAEKMLASAIEKRFEVAERGKVTKLKVTYPTKIKTADFGIQDARLRGCLGEAKEFIVFPNLMAKDQRGIELVSFNHTEITVEYHYRLVDDSLFAFHAVDVRGTFIEKQEEGDYIEMIEKIYQPKKNFAFFTRSELTITHVK